MSRVEENSALLNVYWHYPFRAMRAEGMFLYDENDRPYLDMYGGHCVCLLGHNPDRVREAIAAQGKDFFFYSNWADIPIRERAAERLVRFSNTDFTKVFFCNSGAEANENALKIALQLTGRKKICAFRNCFHGRTMLALGATDHPDWHERFSSWIGAVERLEQNSEADIEKIDEDTACVILEPVQSIGKCTVFQDEYLCKLRTRCDQVGALLVFDEVQTGMGRMGTPFRSGACGVCPDMMTLAKGLGGGFPMSAVVMQQSVAEQINPGDVAATFGGHPLAMAALLATLDEVEERGLMEHAVEMEQYIRSCAESVSEITSVEGKGLILGLRLESEAKPVQSALFERGIIVGHNADPHQLHLLPPLIVQREHIDQMFEGLSGVL